MNKRLKAIMDLIPDGRGVVDVGTDHGYLPVELFRRGYPGALLASDLRPGPLAAARRSAAQAGAEEKIEFLLNDGLAGCDPGRVDTVVIAGMGGDTISGILDRAEWCTDFEGSFILQPMTRGEVLRYWLIHNGFAITRELLVRDGILYQILVCRPGESRPYSDGELYTGSFDQVCRDPLFPEYLDGLIRRFEYEAQGMKNSAENRDSVRKEFNVNVCSQLKEMRRRLEKF